MVLRQEDANVILQSDLRENVHLANALSDLKVFSEGFVAWLQREPCLIAHGRWPVKHVQSICDHVNRAPSSLEIVERAASLAASIIRRLHSPSFRKEDWKPALGCLTALHKHLGSNLLARLLPFLESGELAQRERVLHGIARLNLFNDPDAPSRNELARCLLTSGGSLLQHVLETEGQQHKAQGGSLRETSDVFSFLLDVAQPTSASSESIMTVCSELRAFESKLAEETEEEEREEEKRAEQSAIMHTSRAAGKAAATPGFSDSAAKAARNARAGDRGVGGGGSKVREVCPQGHKFTWYTNLLRRRCDECQETEGWDMGYRCEECDYDICARWGGCLPDGVRPELLAAQVHLLDKCLQDFTPDSLDRPVSAEKVAVCEFYCAASLWRDSGLLQKTYDDTISDWLRLRKDESARAAESLHALTRLRPPWIEGADGEWESQVCDTLQLESFGRFAFGMLLSHVRDEIRHDPGRAMQGLNLLVERIRRWAPDAAAEKLEKELLLKELCIGRREEPLPSWSGAVTVRPRGASAPVLRDGATVDDGGVKKDDTAEAKKGSNNKRGSALVGRSVRRAASGKRNDDVRGEVTHFSASSDTYRVKYSNGEMCRMSLDELQLLLLESSSAGKPGTQNGAAAASPAEAAEATSKKRGRGRPPKQPRTESEDEEDESENAAKRADEAPATPARSRGRPPKTSKTAPDTKQPDTGESATAPRVAGAWQTYMCKATGRPYYHNTLTKVTQWAEPCMVVPQQQQAAVSVDQQALAAVALVNPAAGSSTSSSIKYKPYPTQALAAGATVTSAVGGSTASSIKYKQYPTEALAAGVIVTPAAGSSTASSIKYKQYPTQALAAGVNVTPAAGSSTASSIKYKQYPTEAIATVAAGSAAGGSTAARLSAGVVGGSGAGAALTVVAPGADAASTESKSALQTHGVRGLALGSCPDAGAADGTGDSTSEQEARNRLKESWNEPNFASHMWTPSTRFADGGGALMGKAAVSVSKASPAQAARAGGGGGSAAVQGGQDAAAAAPDADAAKSTRNLTSPAPARKSKTPGRAPACAQDGQPPAKKAKVIEASAAAADGDAGKGVQTGGGGAGAAMQGSGSKMEKEEGSGGSSEGMPCSYGCEGDDSAVIRWCIPCKRYAALAMHMRSGA
eukprot:Tamp_02327.p1 GENE.Tamp_02327~~Tamp_02327.p1  ORF type:complete len:1262 (-),score=187.62 Tamp_02327:663-4097(-)